ANKKIFFDEGENYKNYDKQSLDTLLKDYNISKENFEIVSRYYNTVELGPVTSTQNNLRDAIWISNLHEENLKRYTDLKI
ncbi:hypothetical protein HK099_007070, partial [Clydaea vesicula]